MTSQLLVQLIVPLSAVVLMTAVGLSLSLPDLRDTLRSPRSLVVCTVLQITLLPAAAILLIWLAAPGPLVALVILAIAVSPGGTLTNAFTHLAGGNLALSVMMTTATTLLVSASAPLVMSVAVAGGLVGADATGTIDPAKVAFDMVRIVFLPICVGLLCRHLVPGLVTRLRPAIDALCLLAIGTVLVSSAIVSLPVIHQTTAATLGYAAIFSLLSIGIGRAVAAALPAADRSACTLEFGVRNLPIALVLASGTAPSAEIVAFILEYFFINTAILLALLLVRKAAGVRLAA